MEQALDSNNPSLINEVARGTSMRATREGQEIEALKHIDKDSALHFIATAIKNKINQVKLDKIEYTETKEGTKMNKSEAVEKKIKQDAQDLKKKITKKASDMSSAQDIINSILCK